MEQEKIDFVIIWVDGNDPEWQKEKMKYDNSININNDSREIRYRDWDNLQYWFRGVEKFAPWVNKIHFVTCGQIPKWLNTKNPKINLVNHSDYIPEKYLPTFNSNAIEINLHRIEELSEKFVYFNDDMFLIDKVKPQDFFFKGKPCDAAILNANISHRKNNNHAETANMDIINDYFKKNEVLKKNFFKWFNLKYGKQLIRTICLLPWNDFPGILNSHLPNAFLKSTFETVWKKEKSVLEGTSSHKFRDVMDVNQWIFEDWQLASGNFHPRNANIGKTYAICDDDDFNQKIYNIIRNQKMKMICVNDMVLETDFESKKKQLLNAFEKILPEKSSFEI